MFQRRLIGGLKFKITLKNLLMKIEIKHQHTAEDNKNKLDVSKHKYMKAYYKTHN